MRKIGVIGALAAGFVISAPAVTAAAGPGVQAGCLGVDRAASGNRTRGAEIRVAEIRVAEIRVARRVDVPDGVYRVSALTGAAPSPSTTTTLPLAPTPTRVGGVVRVTHTEDAPPWLALLVPGGVLVIGGIVLLVRARSGPRSRGTR